MKILLFAKSDATHSNRFLALLQSTDNEIIYADRIIKKKIKENNTTYLPYPDPYNLFFLRFVRPYKFQKALAKIIRILEFKIIWWNFQPDIVHIHGLRSGAQHCYDAKLKPMLITAWGSDINDYFLPSGNTKTEDKEISKILRLADHITGDSNSILDRMNILAEKKLSNSNINYGVDTKIFIPMSAEVKNEYRSRLGIPENKKIILCPRRVTPKMGQLEVLDAFEKLHSGNAGGYVLVIRNMTGNVPGYYNTLVEEIYRRGLFSVVKVIDQMPYEDLPYLYNISDIVVNFANDDALPVSFFEAMACKCAIVTSILPDYSELLVGGGFNTVQVHNVEMLSSQMENVLSDDLKRETKIEINYKLVHKVASEAENFSRFIRLYSDIANKSS